MLSALSVLFAIGDSRLWKRTGCSGLLLQPACLNFAPLSPSDKCKVRRTEILARSNFFLHSGKFLLGLDFLTYQEEVCVVGVQRLELGDKEEVSSLGLITTSCKGSPESLPSISCPPSH